MGRTLRHFSLRSHLLALIVVAALVVGLVSAYQQDRRVDRAHDAAAHSVEFVATLAAHDIASALADTRDSVEELAANPGLSALFSTPTPSGCSLTFSGAGPFDEGHIDVVDPDGTVLCSSVPVPEG